MNFNVAQITESANSALASRFYWFFGLTLAFLATFLAGVAPIPFLVCSLGVGLGAFVMLLLALRVRSPWLYVASLGLLVVGGNELGRNFKLGFGALLWQGCLLSLVTVSLLFVLVAPFIRRFCRLPTPAA